MFFRKLLSPANCLILDFNPVPAHPILTHPESDSFFRFNYDINKYNAGPSKTINKFRLLLNVGKIGSYILNLKPLNPVYT